MGTKTHALHPDEWPRYAAALNQASGDALPYAAAIVAILGTGARVGEITPLRECDFFRADGSPKPEITRTLEKKRETVQRLTVAFPWQYIGSPLIRWRAEARRRFLLQPLDCIFCVRHSGKVINQRTIRRKNWAMLEAVGIDPRGVGLHGLRKTLLRSVYRERLRLGDDMMTALRNVQKLAGHARFETTLSYLMDEIEGSHREVIFNVFSVMSQNKQEHTIANREASK